MTKRKANRVIDEEDDYNNRDREEETESDDEDETNEREQLKRNEAELVKKLIHGIMTNCTKRGHFREADFSEIFQNRRERLILKDTVIKKMKTHLKHVFGIKVDRDEENKRFYISNEFSNNIGMRLAEKLENAQKMREVSSSDSEELSDEDEGNETRERPKQRNKKETMTSDFENAYFRHWVLVSTLMFIYMTKRHTTAANQMDKGVDGVLIKNFLNNMFKNFGADVLTEKQYGELLGPAKSAQFVVQGWLSRDIQTDPATGLEEIFYSWGPRAETVVSKKEMLEEFCQIYGGQIQDWPNHAKMAGIRRIGRE